MESESEEELGDTSTLHYQRLRRAEEAWSKVRETALLTTLQSKGSLFGKKCFFCSSVASSRCLDCSPLMSFCESCAVDKHRAFHIFHHVEILKLRNYTFLARFPHSPINLLCIDILKLKLSSSWFIVFTRGLVSTVLYIQLASNLMYYLYTLYNARAVRKSFPLF